MKSRGPVRRRWELSVALVIVVGTGLASRAFPFLFPAAWGKYPGDALWAAMVLFGIAFLRPGIAPLKSAAIALVVSYAVEFSQLYQGAWLNAVRSFRLGHLVLGSGFDWLDFAAYAIGVAAGLVVDMSLLFRVHDPDATKA